MLSDSNITRINNQIEDELRSSRFGDHEDKTEAIARIAALKALLTDTPQTTQTIDYDKLADALIRRSSKSEPEPASPLAELFESLFSNR